MSIQRFHTNDRMSQAVIHGDTVYLAGQVAQGAPGGTVTEQTQAILAQIDSLLAERLVQLARACTPGAALNKQVKQLFLRLMAFCAEYNSAVIFDALEQVRVAEGVVRPAEPFDLLQRLRDGDDLYVG